MTSHAHAHHDTHGHSHGLVHDSTKRSRAERFAGLAVVFAIFVSAAVTITNGGMTKGNATASAPASAACRCQTT